MQHAYIEVNHQFKEPKLSCWKRAAASLLMSIFPMTNPDFEKRYSDVVRWWLEIDKESSWPTREIGFDVENRVIVVGPLRRNYGFWTDNGPPVEWLAYSTIDSGEFEAEWSRASAHLLLPN